VGYADHPLQPHFPARTAPVVVETGAFLGATCPASVGAQSSSLPAVSSPPRNPGRRQPTAWCGRSAEAWPPRANDSRHELPVPSPLAPRSARPPLRRQLLLPDLPLLLPIRRFALEAAAAVRL
jgi:hypothetical protein